MRNLFTTICLLLSSSILLAQNFAPPVGLFNSGAVIKDIQEIDFDNDGDLDIVALMHNKISWLENVGTNEWRSSALLADGDFSLMHIADLDADGHYDILATQFGSPLFFYRNNGDNTFAPRLSLFGSSSARDLTAGDADGDGDLDVFCAYTNSIGWFENLGSSFSTINVINSNSLIATGVEVGDMDGDGDLDAVGCSSSNNRIAWYENTGGGTFGGLQSLSTSADGVNDIALEDMDADGDLDVISAHTSTGEVGYIENLGSSSFASLQVLTSDANNATLVRSTDFDNDGDLDIATFDKANNELLWIEQLAGGTYGAAQVLLTTPYQIELMTVGDFNNDGSSDFLVADNTYIDMEGTTYSEMGYWENTGAASLLPNPYALINSYSWINSIVAMDVDNDGDLDFLNSSKADGKIAWHANQGDATFGPSNVIATSISGATGLVAGDLDNDSDEDLVVASYNGIYWFENLGGGAFSSANLAYSGYVTSALPPTDFDGDGLIDLVSRTSDQIYWQKNLGGGSFGPINTVFATSPFGSPFLWDISIIDLDGDSDQDIVFTRNSTTIPLGWVANNGSGGFGPRIEIPTPYATEPFRLVTNDLDLDGDVDILMGGKSPSWIYLHENAGAALFDSATLIAKLSTTSTPNLIDIDLDNDGDADILSGNGSEAAIIRYENYGYGDFSKAIDVLVPPTTSTAATFGDFDSDGDKDFLSIDGTYQDNNIYYLENLSPQNCEAPPIGLSYIYTPGVAGGTLDLKWTEISAASAYQVRIKKVIPAPEKFKVFLTPTNSLSITAPFPAGGKFQWRVRAACPSDSTDWSSQLPIDIPTMRTAGNSVATVNDFVSNVYPSPASSIVTIDLSAAPSFDGTLAVFDINGKLMLLRSVTGEANLIVEVDNWPTGTYVYQLDPNVAGPTTPGSHGTFIKQ